MPPRGKRPTKKAPRRQVEDDVSDLNQEDDDLLNMEQGNMPGLDQEDLSQEQKDEAVHKTLTTNNPQAPHNTIKFSWKDRQFKKDDAVDQIVFHYAPDGHLLVDGSEEADDQTTNWEGKQAKDRALMTQMNASLDIDPLSGNIQAQKISLRNQFFYQERSSQTQNLPLREKGIKTDPPSISVYSVETTQWMIFDAYMNAFEDERRAEMEEANKNKGKNAKPQVVQVHQEDPLFSRSMASALKIMERMIVQNAEEEKFEDYRYYYQDQTEDPDDTVEGSMLPLWRFTTEKSRQKYVTGMCWNPRYKDLFAVSYGSYNFLKQTTGLICCFTIKNPTWPEYSFTTESGVMCLDFHPSCPALISAGCYDGTVMVFDIRFKSNNKPIYQSTVRTSKHTDPVWQVKWNDDPNAKNLSFYSISSDGRVTNWNLMKNKLEAEEVIKLKLEVDAEKELVDNKKEAFLYGLAGGMCFDFNKTLDHLFLVGTEEGQIHLCSKAYSGQYLETYKDHYLAVYAVKWNTYHPKVFLSCSADWSIKMWNMDMKRPIVTFDLGNPVGDIQWAPYSSTVFAAVTSEGKLYVYDLDQNKHNQMCVQSTNKKATGLHVAFNQEDPIILVGDERGGVISFKLSNTLFKGPLQPVGEENAGKTVTDMEIGKMEKFLNCQDKEVY